MYAGYFLMASVPLKGALSPDRWVVYQSMAVWGSVEFRWAWWKWVFA